VTRLPVGVAAAALCLTLAGCAMTFDSTQLGVPVTMAGDARTPSTGTPFRVTKHPVFVAWGLFTVGKPRLEDVLAGQVGIASGVSQLRIKVRARWSDLLITAITFGFVSPRSVTFDGQAVGSPAP
jgi:hypothetical protein